MQEVIKSINLNIEDWVEKFLPEMDDEGMLVMYETYDEDWEHIAQSNPHHVWTLVDTDEGTVIVNGVWFVNRIHYYHTQIPWKDGEHYDVIDEVDA